MIELCAVFWTLGAISLTYHAFAMNSRSVPSLQATIEKRRQAATARLKRATKFSMMVGAETGDLTRMSRRRDRLDLALSAIKKCKACNDRRRKSLDF